MTKKKGIWAILAVVLLLLLVLVAVAAAQPPPTGGCEYPSPSIAISASPTEIPADGVSTAEIKVVVSWHEESNITGHMVGVIVDMSTSLGMLTDAENQSNNGRSIRLITDTNGIVTALLSGDKTGVAYITSTAPRGGDEPIWDCNKTTVTFVTGATPPAPSSGNGNGGNAGNGGVTSTPITTATPIPSPPPGATAIPTGSPTTSPVRTQEPMSSPGPTPTEDTPGFEAVFVIAGLLVVAYLVLRRERKV